MVRVGRLGGGRGSLCYNLPTMEINPNLIWDYTFTPAERRTDQFKRWYLGRVLSHGTSRDIRDTNIKMGYLRENLAQISLPSKVRKFWQWYLDHDSTYLPAAESH